MNKFIVMTKCPALSGKARQYGRNYLKIALVEVEKDFPGEPKMISSRARGVVKVHRMTVQHVGKTARSYGFRVLQDYKNDAEKRNEK